MGYWEWKWNGLDTSAYEYADDKVDKYSKLLENINEKLDNYYYCQESVESYLDNISTTLNCYNTDTLGHWTSFYSNKCDAWKEYKDTLYKNIDDEYEYAKKRRDRVQEMKDFWTQRRSDEADSLDRKLERLRESARRAMLNL